ncbi:venom allergen 5-like [Venturia canescens]|uniref:venom allergen 5-like n=1 Tax=Venturia canescens TaxID=32260 RepID=UPI001C9C69B3|nr:venom allergen 5-like [Venturia canescens]
MAISLRIFIFASSLTVFATAYKCDPNTISPNCGSSNVYAYIPRLAFRQQIIRAHNDARLKWSDKLANWAQAWANQCNPDLVEDCFTVDLPLSSHTFHSQQFTASEDWKKLATKIAKYYKKHDLCTDNPVEIGCGYIFVKNEQSNGKPIHLLRCNYLQTY